MQIYVYIFISLYHLGCSLPAEMNNVVQFFFLSTFLSPSWCLPLTSCVWSLRTKKKKKCTQQNKPYTLRGQNTSGQKAHSSWAPLEIWNEHVRAQTHRLEQLPPPACHFPASWTTKHLMVARLHTPHPLRQLEKSQPARFIRVCLLCFRFLLQTWTSSWHCPAQNVS